MLYQPRVQHRCPIFEGQSVRWFYLFCCKNCLCRTNPLRVSDPHKPSCPLASSQHKIAALKEAAADRADTIIKGINTAIDAIPTMSIGARVNPGSLKAISDACNKFARDVANQLLAHRDNVAIASLVRCRIIPQ